MGIWNLIFGKILNPFSYTTFPPANHNVTEENPSSCSSNIRRKARNSRKLRSPQNSQQPLLIPNEGEHFIENGNGHPLSSTPADSLKQTNGSSVSPNFPVQGPSSSSTQQQSASGESQENGESNTSTRGIKRRRQKTYSQSEKERAVGLLNQGIPCRKVAEMIDPGMSSGTPIRWRKRMRATVEAQHRLNESLANNNNN